MPTTPGDLLFISMLVDDLQNVLFHLLSRDGSEADWSVSSLVLHLSLFEDGDSFVQLFQ